MSLKKNIILVLTMFLVLIVGLGGYLYLFSQPVTAGVADKIQFAIPRGQAVSVIASRLKEAGLIKSSLMFRLTVKQQGLGTKLQSGSFQISPAMTPAEIAFKLTQGTNDIWVTIPEGWRREEIADSFINQDFTAFDSKEFLNLSIGQEGRLFPDTYLFSRESTAQLVYKTLVNNFEKKVIVGLAKEIDQSIYDLEEALVMASIVEREARGFEEMRHVAGVLWKRIEIGMALQADATLQYAKGYSALTQSWWEPPSAADKKIVSPFNTYLNPGLPPKPIANPGLESIKATLNPLKTNDLFYLHDRSGGIHYAQNLEEHTANVQRYLR
ncbi:endolytic transglycosylase MltG [Patescibacteria group bacterium]|nr:endolytic transglycosylase MltG [Patescibacteria group bacterium]MBU1885485.1 endolytic transglycosylase MltG [Patescibacteria group bacterium]